jgi:hypothetical protein
MLKYRITTKVTHSVNCGYSPVSRMENNTKSLIPRAQQ